MPWCSAFSRSLVPNQYRKRGHLQIHGCLEYSAQTTMENYDVYTSIMSECTAPDNSSPGCTNGARLKKCKICLSNNC